MKTSLAIPVLILLVSCAQSPGADVVAVAHRGLARSAPENTLAAFVAAHGKADLIETDVRVSADGELVIMHDDTVDRTTDGTGTVASLSLEVLKSLDAGSWYGPQYAGEKIPTFSEMIAHILPHATPLIEQKAGTPAAYVNVLQKLGVTSNVVLQSFDWGFLKSVRALDPSIRTCALSTGPMSYDMLAGVARNGAAIASWYKAKVDAAGVSLAHSLGLKVYVWPVTSSEIAHYLSLGVDGIITDVPEEVVVAQQPSPSANIIAVSETDDTSSNIVSLDVVTHGLSPKVGILQTDSLLEPFEPVTPLASKSFGRDRIQYRIQDRKMRSSGFFRLTVE